MAFRGKLCQFGSFSITGFAPQYEFAPYPTAEDASKASDPYSHAQREDDEKTARIIGDLMARKDQP